MILLNKEEPSYFNIDKDLVKRYKQEGDMYLIAVKHDMTKQLVSYKVYYDLQKVNNMFYKIIKSLYQSTYNDLSEFTNDYSELERKYKAYIRNCKGAVPDNIYEDIEKQMGMLMLLMNKLRTICIDFCHQEGID